MDALALAYTVTPVLVSALTGREAGLAALASDAASRTPPAPSTSASASRAAAALLSLLCFISIGHSSVVLAG